MSTPTVPPLTEQEDNELAGMLAKLHAPALAKALARLRQLEEATPTRLATEEFAQQRRERGQLIETVWREHHLQEWQGIARQIADQLQRSMVETDSWHAERDKLLCDLLALSTRMHAEAVDCNAEVRACRWWQWSVAAVHLNRSISKSLFAQDVDAIIWGHELRRTREGRA